VAAGLSDHRPGRIEARTGNQGVVNCSPEPEDFATHVPCRGDAVHEHRLRLLGRQERRVRRQLRRQLQHRRTGERQVSVRLNQSGHQGATGAVDDGRAVGCDLVSRDLFDEVVLNE
jgi:hypothetical protein